MTLQFGTWPKNKHFLILIHALEFDINAFFLKFNDSIYINVEGLISYMDPI